MRSLIVGTAGHIDHGKSALVRALTGTDPDRLPEEKKRGITIDLGFADLEMDDLRLGFVDVPGHERFVRNMLAGAHGIDILVLVIAADEGVMPQTREHFDICRLLGIRQGLIVITKTDLVEDDFLLLVEEEARELVKGSFLADAPIATVSARTGAGLDDLKLKLKEVAGRVAPRSKEYTTRLPVDRAFTMKGFGPVVTGTLIAGEIAEAEELELLPDRLAVRVRGAQVHGKTVARAQAGQRTALNLAGIDVNRIERGMVLAAVGRLRPTQIMDVSLAVLPGAQRSVRTRARVRVHIGAAEVLGRVRVLDKASEIGPGQNGLAQLRLESPVVALHGDRFIVRTYSPAATIAGGVVLDPFAAKHRGKEMATTTQHLRQLMEPSRAVKLAAFVEGSGERGLRPGDVLAATGWTAEVFSAASLESQSRGLVAEAAGLLIGTGNLGRVCEKVVSHLEQHHIREPLSRGILRETLREKLFARSLPELFGAVVARLETEGRIVSENDTVRSSEHRVDLTAEDLQLRERLERIYVNASVEAPSLEDAMTRAGVVVAQRSHGRKILQLLIESGKLLRIQGDMFMHAAVIKDLKAKLLDYAGHHEPDRLIDVAAFKDLAGVSRKYAIPLLEYFDRERVTRRAGDKRMILRAP